MLILFSLVFILGLYEVVTNPTQKNMIMLVCASLVLLEKILIYWFFHYLNNKQLVILRWASTLSLLVLMFNPILL